MPWHPPLQTIPPMQPPLQARNTGPNSLFPSSLTPKLLTAWHGSHPNEMTTVCMVEDGNPGPRGRKKDSLPDAFFNRRRNAVQSVPLVPYRMPLTIPGPVCVCSMYIMYIQSMNSPIGTDYMYICQEAPRQAHFEIRLVRAQRKNKIRKKPKHGVRRPRCPQHDCLCRPHPLLLSVLLSNAQRINKIKLGFWAALHIVSYRLCHCA